MQKCGDQFFSCEKYITIKLGKNLKDFLLAKDKGWAPLWGAVNPQPKLPAIHKVYLYQISSIFIHQSVCNRYNTFFMQGLYTVSNATLDVSLMSAFIPELVQHSWKISATIFNRNDVQQGCGEMQFYIVKYTHRDRKRKRKN